MAGSSRLLALPDDGQRVIFSLLSDALRPAVVLNLSACCRELRAVSEVARAELRRQHSAATRLCARANTTIHDVLGSTDLLWYGQGLTVQHLATLGRCLSTSALSHLEQLNLSVNRFGAEGAIALFDALGRGSLPRLTVLDLTGNAMGAAGAAAFRRRPWSWRAAELEILTLGRNAIGDAGLVALALPLRRMRAQIGDGRAATSTAIRSANDDAGWISALGGTAWPYRLPRRRSRACRRSTSRTALAAGRRWGDAGVGGKGRRRSSAQDRELVDPTRGAVGWQGFGVGSLTD